MADEEVDWGTTTTSDTEEVEGLQFQTIVPSGREQKAWIDHNTKMMERHEELLKKQEETLTKFTSGIEASTRQTSFESRMNKLTDEIKETFDKQMKKFSEECTTKTDVIEKKIQATFDEKLKKLSDFNETCMDGIDDVQKKLETTFDQKEDIFADINTKFNCTVKTLEENKDIMKNMEEKLQTELIGMSDKNTDFKKGMDDNLTKITDSETKLTEGVEKVDQFLNETESAWRNRRLLKYQCTAFAGPKFEIVTNGQKRIEEQLKNITEGNFVVTSDHGNFKHIEKMINEKCFQTCGGLDTLDSKCLYTAFLFICVTIVFTCAYVIYKQYVISEQLQTNLSTSTES